MRFYGSLLAMTIMKHCCQHLNISNHFKQYCIELLSVSGTTENKQLYLYLPNILDSLQDIANLDNNYQMSEKQLKQLFNEPHCSESEKSQCEHSMPPIQSQHYETYQKIMNNFPQASEDDYEYCLNKLHKAGFTLLFQDKYQKQIKIKITKTSVNLQIIVLNLKWGMFETNATILNLNIENKHQYKSCGCGAFGQIYICNQSGNKFAIKCIVLNSLKIRSNGKFMAIKEWFLLKFASACGFGPFIDKYLGFDLLLYKQCIQFAMQQCDHPTNTKIDKINQLYYSLSLMHRLRLVHFDIKPENIMYSRKQGKYVFIDFGLSAFSGEDLGSKNLINFVGSLMYCTPQMSKLFLSNQIGYVDVYYNDLFCLQASIGAIVKNKNISEEGEQDIYGQMVVKSQFKFLNCHLKAYLFEGEFNRFVYLWNETIIKYGLKANQKQMALFFKQLKQNPQLRLFYHTNISRQIKQSIQFIQLNYFYKCFQQSFDLPTIIDPQKKQTFRKYVDDLQQIEPIQMEYLMRKVNVQELLLNAYIIKQTQIAVYFKLYLEYISFNYNVYEVSNQQRYQAALVLYHTFMVQTQTQNINDQRQLIQLTVIFIIQWLQKQHNTKENKNQQTFIKLLLSLLMDTIVFLDLGTVQQHLDWLNMMFDHSFMQEQDKMLIFIKARHAIFLNYKRYKPKKGIPRSKFIQQISNWLEQKSITFINTQTQSKQVLITVDIAEADKQQLQFKVINHINRRLYQIGQQNVLTELRQLLHIDLIYLSLSSNDQKLLKMQKNEVVNSFYSNIGEEYRYKAMYFHLPMFQFFIRKKDRDICQHIYNLWKKNIGWRQVFEQFSLEMQYNVLWEWINFNNFDNPQLFSSILIKIIDFYQNVHEEDLMIFRQQITIILNLFNLNDRVKVLQVITANNLTQKYTNFLKFLSINLSKNHPLKINKNKLEQHQCLNQDKYMLIVKINAEITNIQGKIQNANYLQQFTNFSTNLTCSKCIYNKNIFLIDAEMQKIFQIFATKTSISQTEQSQFINIIAKYKHYAQFLQTQKLKIYFLKKIYTHLFIFCQFYQHLQPKYHGRQHLYRFCKQYNLFYIIFNTTQKFIISMMDYLLMKQNEYIYFLMKMQEDMYNYPSLDKFKRLYVCVIYHFEYLKEDQGMRLFAAFKQVDKLNNTSNFMSMLYISLLLHSQHNKQFYIIYAALLGSIQHLPFKFTNTISRQLYLIWIERHPICKKKTRARTYLLKQLVRMDVLLNMSRTHQVKIVKCNNTNINKLQTKYAPLAQITGIQCRQQKHKVIFTNISYQFLQHFLRSEMNKLP